jgi:hypothetical protein
MQERKIKQEGEGERRHGNSLIDVSAENFMAHFRSEGLDGFRLIPFDSFLVSRSVSKAAEVELINFPGRLECASARLSKRLET